MRKAYITPFLFAVFPILIILGNNIDQVVFSIAIRSLVISILVTAVIFLLFRLVFRHWSLASITTSISLFLFYSYGHVYQWIFGLGEIGESIARHRYMLPLWLVLLSLGVIYSNRMKDELGTVVRMLNFFGILAIIFPLFQIIAFTYQSLPFADLESKSLVADGDLFLLDDQVPPDIYYFILDAYTRHDILLESFDFDNSEFLRNLEKLGFYVAYCSQSNYAQTNLAMASTFNMDYLDTFLRDLSAGDEMTIVPGYIRNNPVRNSLEELGYNIIAFETGFYAVQWMDADVYLFPPRSNSLGEFFNVARINEFEAMLLQTTLAWSFVDLVNLPELMTRINPNLSAPINIYRERTMFVLDQFAIDRVPSIAGPKFVYVHLILPHFPYVFGSDGEVITEEKDNLDIDAYRDQLIYTNKRILEIVKKIVQSAPKPNIIILQGDHGLLLKPTERVAILNAYYLEGEDHEWLYPSISPVNTFRGIFNQYFNGDFENLEDISYFSLYDDPFNFQIVPPTINDKCLIEPE